jgi:hypothetical protein
MFGYGNVDLTRNGPGRYFRINPETTGRRTPIKVSNTPKKVTGAATRWSWGSTRNAMGKRTADANRNPEEILSKIDLVPLKPSS